MHRSDAHLLICASDDAEPIADALLAAFAPRVTARPCPPPRAGARRDDATAAAIVDATAVVLLVTPGWLRDHDERDTVIAALAECRTDPRRRAIIAYAHGTRPEQTPEFGRLRAIDVTDGPLDELVADLTELLPSALFDGDDTPTDRLAATSVRPALALVPAGRFMMGSSPEAVGSHPGESPARRVEITTALYVATTPVTAAQYAMLYGGSKPRAPERPATRVSWFDATDYCDRLSRAEGLEPAYQRDDVTAYVDRKANGYRLATEAEWEYACRAGTTTLFWNSPRRDALTGVARIKTNCDGRCPEVATRPPNPLGLYDMHGCVWEWVGDWHGPYDPRALIDPVGPPTGRQRVVRGGSYRSDALLCRSACRLAWRPTGSASDIGFRVVRWAANA